MTDPFERAVYREKLERDERTARHVRAGFRWHASVYVVVNVFLVVIWAVTDADLFWPVFPIGGWGIGLFFHGLHTWTHLRQVRESRQDIEAGSGAA